ncbi:hypothetical protein B0H16DRAFT_1480174 [Mycena metata]|uniref:Uncharacterized protein n=1 Tax=Mycena metata TaxID=1033252 RepID=A0AAD7H4F0_9AGAR|nr:hypothetical protein B0H16DRAFT_1480174 [Mycena metata]
MSTTLRLFPHVALPLVANSPSLRLLQSLSSSCSTACVQCNGLRSCFSVVSGDHETVFALSNLDNVIIQRDGYFCDIRNLVLGVAECLWMEVVLPVCFHLLIGDAALRIVLETVLGLRQEGNMPSSFLRVTISLCIFLLPSFPPDLTPRSLSERHQTFMNGSYVLGYIVKLELWIPRCATTFRIHPKLNNYDFLPIITRGPTTGLRRELDGQVTGLISRPIGVSVWNMFYLLDAVVLTGRLWEHF